MNAVGSDLTCSITHTQGSWFASTLEFMRDFFYSLGKSPKETLLNPHFFPFDQAQTYSCTCKRFGCDSMSTYECRVIMGDQDNETNRTWVFDSLY